MTDELQGLGQFAEKVIPNTIAGFVIESLENKNDYGKTTERLRKKRVKKDFEKHKDTDLEVFTVRLMPGSREQLKIYFDKRGLSLSQGVRMIVQDFLERQG